MPKRRTVRLVEIAELLSVSKQRVHQIAREDGFPAPVAEDVREPLWAAPDRGVGEALAA